MGFGLSGDNASGPIITFLLHCSTVGAFLSLDFCILRLKSGVYMAKGCNNPVDGDPCESVAFLSRDVGREIRKGQCIHCSFVCAFNIPVRRPFED